MKCNLNNFRVERHVGPELGWAELAWRDGSGATAQDYDMLGEVELVDAVVSARSSFVVSCIPRFAGKTSELDHGL
jgi:hypothetical protein